MLPQTKSGRRFFSGAALLAATAIACVGVRGSAPLYAPEAPAYRQQGAADAPVVITDFSDFQCGGCGAAVGVIKQLQGLFPGKIRVVFIHYPWEFHDWARAAGAAAECAGKRGKFWEYHDALYGNQATWATLKEAEAVRAKFVGYAEELQLVGAEFTACLDDPATAETVAADLREARRHFVNTTPTFLINGRRFAGAQQLRTGGLTYIEKLLK